jgi:radical SAM superfamily enzyme
MAKVSTEVLDKLYEQTQKNETEFFMRILEDPDYLPDTVQDILNEIEKELQQVADDAESLRKLL